MGWLIAEFHLESALKLNSALQSKLPSKGCVISA